MIIEATARRRQRPRSPEKPAAHYSGKKKAHTDKSVVIADVPSRRVSFLSETWVGKAHEKKIAEQIFQAAFGQLAVARPGLVRPLGTGDEAQAWVNQYSHQLSANDVLSSAVEAVAQCIGETILAHQVDEIVVAGGGARNAALNAALERSSRKSSHLSDELGVPVAAREAMAFAILGALTQDRISITLPEVTGRAPRALLSGSWCNIR